MPQPTWEELAQLEPALTLLEHETLKIQDWPDRPYFCANAYWYGKGDPGIRHELNRLVGWGRRGVNVITDRHEGEEGKLHLISALEHQVRSKAYQTIFDDQIKECEANDGLGLLWTSRAYDVAYQHLYAILPDCRHPGGC